MGGENSNILIRAATALIWNTRVVAQIFFLTKVLQSLWNQSYWIPCQKTMKNNTNHFFLVLIFFALWCREVAAETIQGHIKKYSENHDRSHNSWIVTNLSPSFNFPHFFYTDLKHLTTTTLSNLKKTSIRLTLPKKMLKWDSPKK